jgi:hypothetical protein
MGNFTEVIESIQSNTSTYSFNEDKNCFELHEDIEDHSSIFNDLGTISSILDAKSVNYTIDELTCSIQLES